MKRVILMALTVAAVAATAQTASAQVREELTTRIPDPLGDGPPPATAKRPPASATDVVRSNTPPPTAGKSTPGNTTENKPSNRTSASTATGSVVGRYVCQSFDAGLLTNQGEFIINAGGSYRDVWNKKTGGWTYDNSSGIVKFTGTLDNGAVAKYTTTPSGKKVILFTWAEDNLKRWCYRA